MKHFRIGDYVKFMKEGHLRYGIVLNRWDNGYYGDDCHGDAHLEIKEIFYDHNIIIDIRYRKTDDTPKVWYMNEEEIALYSLGTV